MFHILSFDVNAQLMIMVQKTHKVKESSPIFAMVSCERD